MGKFDDKLDAMLAGGRANPERSHALPAHAYRDPAEQAKFASEMLGTKEVELVLATEFENWVRWGRKRDWAPASFRCPLGYLYKSPDVFGGLYRSPPCDDLAAERMERIIVALPPKMREAFVMYRLDRARIGGHVVIVKGRKRKAEILGVTVSHYHYLVRTAHRAILAAWRTKKPA